MEIQKDNQVNKGGRPKTYKPEFCEKLLEYFDQAEPTREVKLEHFDKEGNIKWVDIKIMSNPLPSLRRFAKMIGISYATIYNWANPDSTSYEKEFFDAFACAKEIRKWVLIDGALMGAYNPAFAIFTAKNITDMKDSKSIDFKGKIASNKMTEEEENELMEALNNVGIES